MRNFFLFIFMVLSNASLHALPVVDETNIYTIIWYTCPQQPYRQCFVKHHTQLVDKERAIELAMDELLSYIPLDVINILLIEHLKFHIDNTYHIVNYSISKD